MKPIKSIDDPRYVKAMSHPLRVRILAILDERSVSPHELSQILNARLGTTAYHVRTLEQLGLIKLVRETKVRGAIQHHYRARKRPTISKAGWEQATPIAKQAAVGSSLSVMSDYAAAAAAAGGFDRGDAHLTRTLMRLDAEGFAELGRACDELLAKAEKIEAAAAERIQTDPHADGIVDAALGLLLFEAMKLSNQPRAQAASRPGRSRVAATALS